MSSRVLSRKFTVLGLLFGPQLYSTPFSTLPTLEAGLYGLPGLPTQLGFDQWESQQETRWQRAGAGEFGYKHLILFLQRCQGLAIPLHWRSPRLAEATFSAAPSYRLSNIPSPYPFRPRSSNSPLLLALRTALFLINIPKPHTHHNSLYSTVSPSPLWASHLLSTK